MDTGNTTVSAPPLYDATSPPPPAGEDTPTTSPPQPSSSELPPPPADSSPPPPTPPPPEEDSASPPPPEENSSPPPPEKPTSASPPPPKNSPSPEKSPPPPPSERSPATPLPENSPPPPPAGGMPPSEGSNPILSPPPEARNSPFDASPPPPPAAGRLSPPERSSSGSSRHVSPPASSSSSSSVSGGVITAAAVIGLGILAAVVICLVCSARKKKRREYSMDTPGSARTKGDYFNGSNWNTPQNLRPPPGLMGTTPGSIPTWAPPVPPGGTSSSEYSSGFSGPHGNNHQVTPSPNMALSNQSSFSYEELAQATKGFAQENLLGQGGFGYVHKGVLPSGKEVAVKSLKSGSGQGEREFQAEVEIISRVHHRHLVSLVGYCIADGQRMLVYEFVSNKTLEFHLHGENRPTMEWSTRMRIALGAAKGLGYLHEDCHPRIIHRDIKAANILLDFNFEAMVADFGLAKLTSDNYTHVSTRVMGTFGYMAPEYASSGKLTDKSDVFSFGVMLLELITGHKPIDLTNKTMEDSLVDWARPILARVLENGNYEEIVDPRLGNNFDSHEMDRMMACASASIRHSARRRPKMSQIVRSLEGDQSSLDDTAIKSGLTPESTTYDTTAYNADMMKFKKMVISSNEYGSSEFEHTSDYGLNPSLSSSDRGSRESRSSGAQRQRL